MKVQIEVLRVAIDKLLDHAKAVHGESVDVDADLYWFVQQEELGNSAAPPAGLTLGSLEDDWSAVAAIATGAKDPIGYALVWASTVLRAIGDRTA